MRKLLFVFAALGLAGSLWAADPIIGTWKLNVAKSNYWALLQSNMRELTSVYRELETGQIEVAATGTRTDGSTISFKGIFPRQGGIAKGQTDSAPEGLSSIVTVIDPYTFYLTILENGKQILVYHSTISKDGKTKRDRYKGIDDNGKAYEGVEMSDKQ